jgi:hypothetical protein
MHAPGSVPGAGILQENEKHKNRDMRASTPATVPSTGMPTTRKFLKSKSKMFKFWM